MPEGKWIWVEGKTVYDLTEQAVLDKLLSILPWFLVTESATFPGVMRVEQSDGTVVARFWKAKR